MDKFNLVAIILQVVCGLVCIGLGIYYCISGAIGQTAIFFLVGVGCFVNAVRIFLNGKKKDDADENKPKQ